MTSRFILEDIPKFILVSRYDLHLKIGSTVYNGYSDILDIVILLSLSIFPHLRIRHTKFIGYSDDLAVKFLPPAISLYPLYTVSEI